MSTTMPTDSPARRRAIPAADARNQILDAAEALFYREGARNVGVDAVVKAAGVNKMSLYRQFASKDELLRQYLDRRDARFWQLYQASLAHHPDNALAGLRQVFIDLAARIQAADYRGCPFVNIACEFPERSHPARLQVADNKRRLLAWLTDAARDAGAVAPPELAAGLALLIEGAYTASQTYPAGNPLLTALPRVADVLIRAALPPQLALSMIGAADDLQGPAE
ncbi:TetR/AcrR family transcriptional regulator [Chitinimonas sp.]|uniref:TetR/AcrR family transcriptional regulator n=1 Tax=Chitinimonas sp. TaxID=1934313 RepID=UPI0035B0B3D9